MFLIEMFINHLFFNFFMKWVIILALFFILIISGCEGVQESPERINVNEKSIEPEYITLPENAPKYQEGIIHIKFKEGSDVVYEEEAIDFVNNIKENNFQLVVIPSMRTPKNIIQYAKDYFGENHIVIETIDKKAYLSALAISEKIVVTCDSSSMISEAALTGKPIYVANISPKKNDKRFQRFRNLFRELNIIRNLGEEVEIWSYEKLDETNRVANIIKQKINL